MIVNFMRATTLAQICVRQNMTTNFTSKTLLTDRTQKREKAAPAPVCVAIVARHDEIVLETFNCIICQ